MSKLLLKLLQQHLLVKSSQFVEQRGVADSDIQNSASQFQHSRFVSDLIPCDRSPRLLQLFGAVDSCESLQSDQLRKHFADVMRLGRFFGGSGESSEIAIRVVRHLLKQKVTQKSRAPNTYRSRASGMMT